MKSLLKGSPVCIHIPSIINQIFYFLIHLFSSVRHQGGTGGDSKRGVFVRVLIDCFVHLFWSSTVGLMKSGHVAAQCSPDLGGSSVTSETVP